MIISSEGTDGYVYWQELVYMHRENGNVISLFENFFIKGETVDILGSIIIYSLSLFTNSAKILFAVFGLIFGYFYSRLIWISVQNIYKYSLNEILLLSCFTLVIPFWNINGFRFWTASIIFVYGVCHYFLKDKKTGFLFLIFTPLLHFSFAGAVLIVIVYRVLGNKMLLYFLMFLGTTFFSVLDVSFLQNISSAYFPEVYDNRVVGYTNEAYTERVVINKASKNWYLEMRLAFILFFARTLLISLYIFEKKLVVIDNKYKDLLAFTLLFYSFANLVSNIPSGGRFMSIANMFLFFILVCYYPYFNFKIKRIITIGTPILLFFIIVQFRVGFDYINITTIFGNPIIAMFFDNTTSLINLFK